MEPTNMVPYLFGGLAGVLIGLAIANLRNPLERLGRAGMATLILAAAAALALSTTFAPRIDAQISDLLGYSGGAALLARLLLIAAGVAWCTHLLNLINQEPRASKLSATAGVLAAGLLIWQWHSAIAPSPLSAFTADLRWYDLAFIAGIGIPQLITLVCIARWRRGREATWASLLIVGAIVAMIWCAYRLALAFTPTSLDVVPRQTELLLIFVAASFYWFGSTSARATHALAATVDELAAIAWETVEPEPEPNETAELDVAEGDATREEHAQEAPDEEVQPDTGAQRVAPPPPEPIDPARARSDAAAIAVALAKQLAAVGRDQAVAVGTAGGSFVFATADGLGYLPEGGFGADNLHPLITRVPDEFSELWLGCAHPAMPLLAADEQGYVGPFDAVVTIDTDGHFVDDDLRDIEPAPLTAPRVRTDAVRVSETHAVLAELRDTWGVDLDADTAGLAETVAAARWTTWPNPDYRPRWVAELASRATDDLQAGDVGSAQYALQSARRVPPPPAPVPEAAIDPEQDEHERSAAPSSTTPVSEPEVAPVLEPEPEPMPEAGLDPSPAPALRALPTIASSPPPPAAAAPPKSDLPSASTIVAALARQIPGNAEIAAATLEGGTAIFCTSDGLGYLPDGANTSAEIMPLAVLADHDFAARWLGCDTPHLPLIAAAETGLIPPPVEIATTCPGAGDGVVSLDENDLKYAVAYELTTSREKIAAIEPSEVDEALRAVEQRFGSPAPGDDAAAAFTAAEVLRWTGAVRPEYRASWARYLQLEAIAALERGHVGAACYLLARAVQVPPVEDRAAATQ